MKMIDGKMYVSEDDALFTLKQMQAIKLKEKGADEITSMLVELTIRMFIRDLFKEGDTHEGIN